MTTRRGFLAGIIAAGMAPAIAKSGILMPVKKIFVPPGFVPPSPVWKTEVWDLEELVLEMSDERRADIVQAIINVTNDKAYQMYLESRHLHNVPTHLFLT